MTCASWIRAVVAAVGATALLAGCVDPGGVECNLLAAYQAAALRHSPQARRGAAGLDLLRPVPGTTGDEVDVRTGPDGVVRVPLSLDQAIRLALLNSMDIKVVSFDPAIAREQMVQAAAAFDWTVFAGVSHVEQDRRSSAAFTPAQNDVETYQVGLRERTIWGTQIELRQDLIRSSDNNAFTMPDPRWESVSGVQITQPLLRNAGSEFNLAELRLARLGHRLAYAQFRERVEQVVSEVQTGYWNLVQARRELEIQENLLALTVETYDRVYGRRELDATAAEIKQTAAAVALRRAFKVRAEKAVMDAQDQLVRLLAHQQINLLGEFLIVPTTEPVACELAVDSADQLVQALKHNPVMEQARLGIQSAQIRVSVAGNQVLPVLNLTAATAISELQRVPGRAFQRSLHTDFIDHSLGAVFEYPLGNRAAVALLRQRRLERLQALADLQNLADQVALRVNEAIRQIRTTYQELLAQQAAVDASTVQLEALEALEKNLGRLTPEFLQVKLAAQGTLAEAQRGLASSITGFNNARAQLAQVTGTSLMEHRICLAMEAAGDYMPAPACQVAPTPAPTGASPWYPPAAVKHSTPKIAPDVVPTTSQPAGTTPATGPSTAP